MYPAANVSACRKFENRIRPWYVTTATPSPKNIVILLDSSTSMGFNNSLDAAKETAKIVVSTLNPQDKVHRTSQVVHVFLIFLSYSDYFN